MKELEGLEDQIRERKETKKRKFSQVSGGAG